MKSVGELGESSSSDDGSGSDPSMSSTSASSSATSSASESGSEVDSGNPTEHDSGEVDSGNPTETGECTPEGESMCEPVREIDQTAANWTISGIPEFSEEPIELPCTVDTVEDDGTTLSITLLCDEGELAQHVVEIPSNPITPLNLGGGTVVTLYYEADPIFWINRWFALRGAQDQLIVGGVDGSELLPPTGNGIFLPLELTVDPTACPLEVPCEPVSCGSIRRQAIDVLLDVESAKIFDGQAGNIAAAPNSFDLVVARAVENIDTNTCEDVPPAWYSIVLYDAAEG